LNVKAKLLLLPVDFANHRHPFFDLSQHTQIGAARVHWIARRTWRGISRINDTLDNDTLGHGYLVQNRVTPTSPNHTCFALNEKAQG
jgi:hypothetical protein